MIIVSQLFFDFSAKKSSSSTSSTSAVVSCGICSVDVKTVTSFFLHWLDAHHQITEVLQEVKKKTFFN